MKKLIWAIVALLVVVAISFYQSQRQEKAKDKAFKQGYNQAGQTIDSLDQAGDSLKKALEDNQLQYQLELDSTNREYSSTLDSLSGVVVEKDKEIDSLVNQSKDKTTSTTQAGAKNKRHEEILSYYKKRYRELPGDLSAYEHRVALSEIREETVKKFSITLQELNRIRKSNNLDY